MKILEQQEKVSDGNIVLTQQVEKTLTLEELEQMIAQCRRNKAQYVNQIQRIKEAYAEIDKEQKEYERLLNMIPSPMSMTID